MNYRTPRANSIALCFFLFLSFHSFAVGITNDTIFVLESPKGKKVMVPMNQELQLWVLGQERSIYGKLVAKDEDTITIMRGSEEQEISIILINRMQLVSSEKRKFLGLSIMVVGAVLLIFALLFFILVLMNYLFGGAAIYIGSISSIAAAIAIIIWGYRIKGRIYDLGRWKIRSVESDGG